MQESKSVDSKFLQDHFKVGNFRGLAYNIRMIKIQPQIDGDVIEVQCSGTVTREDYRQALPEMEKLLCDGQTRRFFILLRDMDRFEAGAVWEDLKFDLKHKEQYGKMAVVGDRRWEEWVISISRPFFNAEIKYFPMDQEEKARKWVHADGKSK